MAKPKKVSNLFMPFTSKGPLRAEKERIRFQLAKTVTVDGYLKVSKHDKSLWKVGNTKFKITPGNGWVKSHLTKFRNQRITVRCWIRDDGILLSVRTSQSWSRV